MRRVVPVECEPIVVVNEGLGFVQPPIARYRRSKKGGSWHFCQNCPDWPL